jgi:hypothetical protein
MPNVTPQNTNLYSLDTTPGFNFGADDDELIIGADVLVGSEQGIGVFAASAQAL